MNALRLKRALILALVSFSLLHVGIFWHVRDSVFQGYGDFASFYTAGKIVQHGESTRLYDRELQWQVQQEFASTVKSRRGPLPYIRPPFEALLFLPFAYLRYPVAFLAWTLIKLVVLFALPLLLVRETAQSGLLPPPRLQGFLCLGFYPIAFDLLQGQDSILFLLIFTLVFTSLRGGSSIRSGVYLGLGLFKFHLVIPFFLVLLLKRQWRAVIGFLCVASGLILISVALVGRSGFIDYPRYLWSLNQTPSHLGINGSVMPNIRGLLTPLIGIEQVPPPVMHALLCVSILGIAGMARIWPEKGDSRSNRMGFSFCIVVILVTSYYTTSHDLTLLILPFLLTGGIFASDAAVRGGQRTLFFASVALLLCSPLYLILLSINMFFGIALVLLVLALSLAMALQNLGNSVVSIMPNSSLHVR